MQVILLEKVANLGNLGDVLMRGCPQDQPVGFQDGHVMPPMRL